MEESCTSDASGSDSIKENPLKEEFGNAPLLFSISFLILFVSVWYLLKGNGFWAGILAFSASSILALGYMFISDSKKKKQ